MKYKEMTTPQLINEIARVKELMVLNKKPHTYHQNRKYLEKTCKKGMVVLDSFCGSGTVPKVCQELELNFIAFEIDKKWWQVANDRLNGIDQNGNMNLFDI